MNELIQAFGALIDFTESFMDVILELRRFFSELLFDFLCLYFLFHVLKAVMAKLTILKGHVTALYE